MTNKILYNSPAGEILKTQFIDKTNINCDQLANEIDIPADQIQQIISGERLITADIDSKLCKYFSLSAGYFIRMQISYQTMEARKRAGRR